MKTNEHSLKIKDLLRIDLKRSNLQIGDIVICIQDTLATGKKTSITKNKKYKVMKMMGRDMEGFPMSIGIKDDEGVQRTFTQSFFNVVD